MFGKLTQRYIAELDAAIRSVVDTFPTSDAPGIDAMLRYPLGWVDKDGQPYHKHTGKRLRPILLLLCTEANRGDWRTALPAAAAVEILHNFSLIHDDIQDGSLTRHGRETVWKIWGKSNAINIGDALFSLAYLALAKLSTTDVPADTVLKIWHIFNKTNLDLTRGQYLDMRFEKQDTVSVDEYISMISGKSAALLAACTQIGALVAMDDETIANRYADFGLNLGIAFQIHDDALGIWGDPKITGKSAATDIISRKKSLPVLYGLSRSSDLINIYKREDFDTETVKEAVHILDSLGAQTYTQEKERYYYKKSLEALNKAGPQDETAGWLRECVEILFRRKY